jgi:hypothetical protein
MWDGLSARHALALDVWAGVVPVALVKGEPIKD